MLPGFCSWAKECQKQGRHKLFTNSSKTTSGTQNARFLVSSPTLSFKVFLQGPPRNPFYFTVAIHRIRSPLLLAICGKFVVNLHHSELLLEKLRGEAIPPEQHSTALTVIIPRFFYCNLLPHLLYTFQPGSKRGSV